MPFDEGHQQPPSYAQYPGGPVYPVYVDPPRPLGGLAKALYVLLGAAALVSVGGAFMRFSRASFAADYRQYLGSIAEADAADSRVAVFAVLFIAVFLATAVVFMIWQYRLAMNAQATGQLGLGPGWAIGAWFIPVANFIMPALQMRGSARASGFRPPAVVVVWAVVFAASSVTYGTANRQLPDEPPVATVASVDRFFAELAKGDRTAAVAMIIYVVAALLAIVMVRALTTGQEAADAARRNPGGYRP
ncbi:uncharacterized protein DUF4328 [Actinocrispum wychmicini]|uniref:Uncharacterized protein DUF4328 n=2 Tax=Actinocrispum wychmicini TaxID=1213861 RepID=A0A4R2JAT3_9PSEU|nr:uncharacterized protein DUF4328 [Actinocrispum wychmicini]